MRLVIVTHNLGDANRHLMPWRTVCEVTDCWRAKEHLVEIISLGSTNRDLGLSVRKIKKDDGGFAAAFSQVIREFSPDVVFWPLSWRESKFRLKMLGTLQVPVVAYFPGGYYLFSAVWYAWRKMGLRASRPYMLEFLYEKIRNAVFFHRQGVDRIITMSQHHREMFIQSGGDGDKVSYIPPGKDGRKNDSGQSMSGLPNEFIDWLSGRNYFLFMGPPAAIRGIFELLEAFELAAARQENFVLVCLLRDDAELDSGKIKSRLASMRCRDRVYVVWQSVNRDVFEAYLAGCRAVFLPFIIVPSEIPLAIIETMAFGKPVVTTIPGGTGEFVRQCGAVVPLGDVEALANEMVRLVVDEVYYRHLCEASLAAYERHPTWEKVAGRWLQVGRQAIAARQDRRG